MAHGKKYLDAAKLVDHDAVYPPAEAAELVRQTSTVNFDPTVEAHLRLGVDPRHADQMVRGTVVLPHGTGKVVRVVVFAQGEKAQEALRNGADEVGAEDLVKKIEAGWPEFDVALATPDTMGMVGRLGKILGRKGLMPNPKSGTITFDIERALKEVKGGRVEFKVDKGAHHPCRLRQGQLRGRPARRQPRRARRRREPGQAGRREGPVPQDAVDLQHDGPRASGSTSRASSRRRSPDRPTSAAGRPASGTIRGDGPWACPPARRLTTEYDGSPKTACARGPRHQPGGTVGA